MCSFSFKYLSSVMAGIRASLRENDRTVGGQDSGDAEKIKIQVIYSGIPFYFTLFPLSTLHCAAVEKTSPPESSGIIFVCFPWTPEFRGALQ